MPIIAANESWNETVKSCNGSKIRIRSAAAATSGAGDFFLSVQSAISTILLIITALVTGLFIPARRA